MHHKTKSMRLVLPFTLVLFTGCFHLAREEPVQLHYVLGGSRPPNAGPRTTGLEGIAVGIRRLRLADYLATPLIVVRRGPHTVDFSESHRWGGELAEGISRAVAGYMGDRAAFRAIEVAPWQPQARFDYLVQLEISGFEGMELDRAAHVLAAWEIIRQDDGTVLARGVTDFRGSDWEVDDYDGLVALLDTGLGVLSDDLVASLGLLVAR